MAGMLQQLIEVLEELADRHDELLGLSLEKREVIVKNEIEELQKINNLENIIVSKNNRLEKKRAAIVHDLSLVFHCSEEELTISKLIELIGDSDIESREKLQNLSKRLNATLKELKESNIQNGELILNALEFIDYSINVMRAASGKAEVYYPGMDSPAGFIDEKY